MMVYPFWNADIHAHTTPVFELDHLFAGICVFSYPPLLLDKKQFVSMKDGVGKRYGTGTYRVLLHFG